MRRKLEGSRMMLTRRSVTAALAAAPLLGQARAAGAFPTRPVRMFCGYLPGGTTDIICRILAERLGNTFGQNVVVENRTGASGLIALAQRLHDEHVAAGEQRSTELVAEAEATAARLVSDAEEQKARTLEALAEEKAGLEGEVEQLRSFETDYRSRLTSYIEGQLREIRAQKRVEPPTPTA